MCEDKSGGVFNYSSEAGLQFDDDEYISKEFSNLKVSIVKHIQNSKTHVNSIMDRE